MESPREKDAREQQRLIAHTEIRKFNSYTPHRLRQEVRAVVQAAFIYNMKYN